MATPKPGMLGHIAASVDDHRPDEGQGGAPQARSSIARQADGRRRLEAASLIRCDRIIPDPNQPRTEFDPEALDRLAASLKARGQLQPIRVRWDDAADRYVVVVGERRWRAAVMAGLDQLACIVHDAAAGPDDLLEDQLIENALRDDLKPVEQARAYRTLMDRRGLTQVELAERLQISQPTIARTLGLLDLPPAIQASVDEGEIPASVGYELVKVSDPAEQAELAEGARSGRLRREDIQRRAKASKGRGPGKAKPRKVTARTFRTAAGPRITIEWARGLTDDSIEASLQEALDRLREERGRGEAA